MANLPIAVIPAGILHLSFRCNKRPCRLRFACSFANTFRLRYHFTPHPYQTETKLILRQRLGRQLIWKVSSNVRGLAGLQTYCRHLCVMLMSVRTMVADLMVAKPIGGGNPVWLFLSVALGWIAYADIHTEKLRYLPDTSIPLAAAYPQIPWRQAVRIGDCLESVEEVQIPLLRCYFWPSHPSPRWQRRRC